MIKNKCVSCGAIIENPKENYKERGNYCQRCCGRADLLVSLYQLLARPQKNKKAIEKTLRKLRIIHKMKIGDIIKANKEIENIKKLLTNIK